MILPIKAITAQDRKRLRLFYNANFPLSRWSRKKIDRYCDGRVAGKLSFVLQPEKQFAGLIMGEPDPDRTDAIELSTLVVSKRYRGKGYAGLMIKRFVAAAGLIKGIRRIIVHFRDRNDLKKFYAQFGFGKHRISGRYTNGEKKHQMELDLINSKKKG